MKKPPPQGTGGFFKFQKDMIMEIITDTIQLEELDELARLILRNTVFDGTEALGFATALAVEAGRLSIRGELRKNTAINEAITAVAPAA